MSGERKLLLLPGDGIGPEVIGEVPRVIKWLEAKRGIGFKVDQDLFGGASIEAHGKALTEAALAKAKAAGAVIFGAIGGPKWTDNQPERGLLKLRKEMGLFANLRPAVCFDALADTSSLKHDLVSGLNIMIVRELIGGIYYGLPSQIDDLGNGERRAYDTEVYTTHEVHRIARVAFDLARKRKNHVTSVEKSNVMAAGRLWREEVQKIRDDEFPDVELQHMFIDNCAMQLIRQPKQFDVILTGNLFGDILSDEAAMLTGSLGMLPSAALGAPEAGGGPCALYEPVHGSAPDIAGQGIANPIATILSFAMALRYTFDLDMEAHLIERAVNSVLAAGMRTVDVLEDGMTKVSTSEMGAAIVKELDLLAG
jgi:3-isopropylmalate dehydrogenase